MGQSEPTVSNADMGTLESTIALWKEELANIEQYYKQIEIKMEGEVSETNEYSANFFLVSFLYWSLYCIHFSSSLSSLVVSVY